MVTEPNMYCGESGATTSSIQATEHKRNKWKTEKGKGLLSGWKGRTAGGQLIVNLVVSDYVRLRALYD
ncbi:hypothetical protein F2Q68_00015294 [Brassica cretica]|uniref:Uncharacterized protein n=1 Tax=Brassica cretica TaxID=69181 RepID=A0A8S9HBS4_BRACR|nr:hypothetical protein F2Q68_00015294 [Brassica cretica]